MTKGTAIPFEKKTLFLKQVRMTDLEDMETLALHFFFPGYHDGSGFDQANLSKASLLGSFRTEGFTLVEDKNSNRRYAGDFSLPRSSYFTVCRTAEGDDGGLLMYELKTYSKPHMSGYVVLLDSAAPNPNMDFFRSILKPGASALFCIPQELIHFPSPFRQLMKPDAINKDAQIVAIIPTWMIKTTFERLIDLRMPKTRQWFVRELTRLKNEDPPLPVFPLAGPLDDFRDLLPTLLSQGLGGGRGVTQVAGSWLRRLGAEALIFPSARVDVSVTIADGELEDWYGWNLVDNRGAPPPFFKSFTVLSPEWDRYPTTLHHDLVRGEAGRPSEAPVEFSHVKILATDSGRNAGSLSVSGIELVRGFYHDTVLWTFYTDRMDDDLKNALMDLTFFAASDGKQRGLYLDRLAGVCRMFIAAINGNADAKESVTKLPSIPHVAANCPDCSSRIKSFLALCD